MQSIKEMRPTRIAPKRSVHQRPAGYTGGRSRSSNGGPTDESEFVLFNDQLKWPLNLGPVDSYVRCQQPGNKLPSLAGLLPTNCTGPAMRLQTTG
jgi:hypothetical protein